MITGTHTMIFSKDAAKDRAFFRDVLKFPYVDNGGNWLIFDLPKTEMGIHPSDSECHEIYFLCEDINDFIDEMKSHGILTKNRRDEPWGKIIDIELPGGSTMMIYEPLHKRPKA
ncbi:extradiol dioxygenase [Acidaminobacter sp. JC074]|uniref:VOC family protein n=1 Tax=Acidaminobacter sp. JC074 TaxID=2530199 RepID=UPI001F1040B5|nr:hypothetical protein [Acidaminobacter sp. JC074]MCH4887324.1 extradiol dioxygenase [Acidaminobacter sp. JC074]